MQTIRKIREYKSAEAKHYKYPATTIDTGSDDEKWTDVSATYMDFVGECKDRNSKPFNSGGRNLRNTTGRNDIESVKVAKDGENLYFRVACASDITAYENGDAGWMNIWIKTGERRG